MLDFFFRFDALSHRSSGNSLNVSENMGVVSKTSTPLSGSLENLGGGELLRKNFGGANSTSSQRCVLKRFRSLCSFQLSLFLRRTQRQNTFYWAQNGYGQCDVKGN